MRIIFSPHQMANSLRYVLNDWNGLNYLNRSSRSKDSRLIKLLLSYFSQDVMTDLDLIGEACRPDAGHHTRLIFVRRTAAGTRGADDCTAVHDQHSACDRNNFTAGHIGKGTQKSRTIFQTVGQAAARFTHADRAPRFADSDLRAQNTGAVLALERFEIPTVIQDGDGKGAYFHFSRFRQRLVGDDRSFVQR